MEYGNYLYTQSSNDRRGILWTKYVLMWALKQIDQTENTDTRLIELDSGVKITVGNMFIYDQQNINPNFVDFLKTTAAYHVILLAPDTTLANNKYARKFYEHIKKNYGRMPTELKNFNDMLFSLTKKMNTGINKTLPLSTNISPYEYSEYSLIKTPTSSNRFAFYIPHKVSNIVINDLGSNNQNSKAYQIVFNRYLTHFTNILNNQLFGSSDKNIILENFYNQNIAPNNPNVKVWNNNRKYENVWDNNAIKNKCFGLGIKDPKICKELMFALTKAQTYDGLRTFMITYSQPEYDGVWSTLDEMVDLASKGRINLSIARRFLRYLGFKFSQYSTTPDRQASNAYTNWINVDGNKHFNDPSFTAIIMRSTKVANFLRVLSEYVAYTYNLRIPENIEDIVNLGSVFSSSPSNYTNNREKTWDYAERYDDYIDKNINPYDLMTSPYDFTTSPYDFIAMLLLSDPKLLNKINNLYVDGIGISKTNDVSIDEYMRRMELPKNRINTIRVFSGGNANFNESHSCGSMNINNNFDTKKHINYFEKLYYGMKNKLKDRNMYLDKSDDNNLSNQIHNLNIYWNSLNKATKNLSDSKIFNGEEEEYKNLKKTWKENYVKYKKQEIKVLTSLTLLLQKMESI